MPGRHAATVDRKEICLCTAVDAQICTAFATMTTDSDDDEAEVGVARTAARIGGATAALLLLADLRRPSEATTPDTVEELLMSD